MTSKVELINSFDHCITASVTDSISDIARQFALAQTKYGWDQAIEGLAMAFVIAENRRRFLETELAKH
ncbi:Uncharacterised protein [Budvicia aquatica]|uniref:Uncharacterized protein n=2 Tax=Budvicia aquatica TaxID=82979 RepID=A0A2C6DS79_9GAMM|nr:hypothetical protein [Budvicia aquatica]PHI31182.1 hypothetical protein CRN84_18465 [Budvicia aquatica]VFS51441.1 Uncharacterised protein [Budvicia aquatica]